MIFNYCILRKQTDKMLSKTSLTLGDWISNAYEGGGQRSIYFIQHFLRFNNSQI